MQSKRLILVAALSLNLALALFILGSMYLAGVFGCIDSYNHCTTDLGIGFYIVLFAIWGLGPFIYLIYQDHRQGKR